MNTAEKIFDEVKVLPETEAREVLDFVEYLKARREQKVVVQRDRALATLEKFRGRFKAGKFNRDECYDRKIFR